MFNVKPQRTDATEEALKAYFAQRGDKPVCKGEPGVAQGLRKTTYIPRKKVKKA